MHIRLALQREGEPIMFLHATSIPARAKNVDGRTMAVSTTRYGGRPPKTGGVIIFLHASLACLGRTTTPPNVTSFTHAAVTHLDRAERRPKSAISGGMLCNQLPCVLTVLLEYACMPEMHAKK